MKYIEIVRLIRELNWKDLSTSELECLMILSAYAAREFAESLRITLALHPESTEFRDMSVGELDTNNIQHEEYSRTADHADFLWYFIEKYQVFQHHPEAITAGESYLNRVRVLPREVRAMSIVSRERELPGIFEQVLKATDWSTPALRAFRHYLVEHIRLDSMEGGHADLLSNFQVTNSVSSFYQARLEIYRCIPTLWKN